MPDVRQPRDRHRNAAATARAVACDSNALTITHAKLWDFTAEEIETTFRTNIESMFHLAKAVAAKMKPGAYVSGAVLPVTGGKPFL